MYYQKTAASLLSMSTVSISLLLLNPFYHAALPYSSKINLRTIKPAGHFILSLLSSIILVFAFQSLFTHLVHGIKVLRKLFFQIIELTLSQLLCHICVDIQGGRYIFVPKNLLCNLHVNSWLHQPRGKGVSRTMAADRSRILPWE